MEVVTDTPLGRDEPFVDEETSQQPPREKV